MRAEVPMSRVRRVAGGPGGRLGSLSGRRGSVLVLVIAVLVLLALMGTAYIVTSRSDRVASAQSEASVSIDALGESVIGGVKDELAAERVATVTGVGKVNATTPRVGSTASPTLGQSGTAGQPTGFSFFEFPTGSPPQVGSGLSLLASRTPSRVNTNVIVWEHISQPLGSTNSVQQVAFADPTRVAGNTAIPDTYRTYGVQTTSGVSRRFQFVFEPTAIALADGTQVPAFQIYAADPTTHYRANTPAVTNNFAPTAPTWNATGTPFVAADADGDGIADAGLVKIGNLANPEYSGVTFYYGLRVIDNNSALNANTAGWPYLDYLLDAAFTRTTNDRVFPSAVNLVQLLSPTGGGTPAPGNSYDLSPQASPAGVTSHQGATLYALHQFRFGGTFPGVGQTSPSAPSASTAFFALRIPYGDLLTTNTATVPYSPARRNETGFLNVGAGGPLRPDFEFTTLDELTWMQLGRRLDNPGLFNLGTGATYPSGLSLQGFGMQDQASLATGFVLATRDPARSFADELARRSAIEQVLPYSTYRTAQLPTTPYAWPNAVAREIPTTPYAPDQASQWYRDNFAAFMGGGVFRDDAAMSLRPLLVARNPVSQAVATKPLPHWAVMPPPVPTTTTQIEWDAMSPYARLRTAGRWTFVPVAGSGLQVDAPPVPVKVDVNAAAFGDLWRAYYSVMASDQIDPRSQDSQRPGSGAGSVTTVYEDTVSPFGPYTPLTTPTEETFRGMGHEALSASTEDPTLAFGVLNAGAQNALVSVRPTPEAALRSGVTVANEGTPATFHPQRMFRSSVKDFATSTGTETRIAPDQMVLLRSAQAAVNAEYHRTKQRNYRTTAGTDLFRDDIVRRSVPLKATVAGTTPSSTGGTQQGNVLAQVYSAGRFPYISEVYVSTNPAPGGGSPNYKGYVAVELFNPHPYAISLAHFRIERVLRTPSTGIPASPAGRATQVVYEFGTSATAPVIPPLGTIVLENVNTSTSAGGAFVLPSRVASSGAPSRPSGLTLSGTGSAFYVEGLDWVLESSAGVTGQVDYEMVISRPMIADIENSAATGGVWAIVCLPVTTTGDVRVTDVVDTTSSTPGKEPQDYFVPIDSIDFSGVRPATTTAGQSVEWPLSPLGTGTTPRTRTVVFSYDYHYARSTADWRMVYPGRYDGRTTTNGIRQQGLRELRWRSSYTVVPNPASDGGVIPQIDAPVPLFTTPAVTLGTANPDATYTQDATGTTVPLANSKRTPSIQIANSGGFVRELDLIQSPYVSPVRLRALVTSPDATPVAHTSAYSMTYLDVISLTADAAFAEDTCTHTDLAENIGRFAPILVPRPAGWNPQTTLASAVSADQVTFWVDEFSVDPTKTRYGWALRLNDYLTVMPAGRMTLPVAWDRTTYSVPSPFATSSVNSVPSQPVTASAAAMQDEDPRLSFDGGVNGQININTAPVTVLAAIPWVRNVPVPGSDPVPVQNQLDLDRAANLDIAEAIVAYRQAYGPFRHILELNRVPGFRTRQVANTTNSGWVAIGTEQTATPDTTRTFAIATRASLTASQAELVNDNVATNTQLASANGDFSPELTPTGTVATPWGPNPPANGLNALIDFEPQYLVVTAVSNLITTRSDTFTAYLVIEGWRDAGTVAASRVYQRRYAYILDRTGVAVGTPNASEMLDPAYVTPVVQPESSGAFTPTYWNVTTGREVVRPRFESTTVRTTDVPVPQTPTRVGQ